MSPFLLINMKIILVADRGKYARGQIAPQLQSLTALHLAP